jgi:hypothetical protein
MATGTVFSTEQAGIQKADAILIGVSAAMVPAVLSLHSSLATVVGTAKCLLNAAIVLNIPALATLLWHSVRRPVRVQLMNERIQLACKAFADDMVQILESVAAPAVRADIMGPSGENIVEGPSGKKYVRMTEEEAERKMHEGIARSLAADNPIVANTIAAHSTRIFNAQQGALTAPLDEKFARLKCAIDLFCLHSRYWWFLGVVICATASILCLINK